jgi:uncharacterized membrane protein YeaQ/YmgE (transglycosylase-associated protein family)
VLAPGGDRAMLEGGHRVLGAVRRTVHQQKGNVMTISAVAAQAVTCREAWGVGSLLLLLLGGIIIGLLGKFVAPGNRDNIPLWLTVACGIAGILLGNLLYTALGGRCETPGVDWLRHFVQIITAAVLVVLAATVTGRSRSKVL